MTQDLDPKAIWDDYAKVYPYTTAVLPHSEELLPDVIRLAGIESGMRVLDLACGTGALASKLTSLGIHCRVVGLDFSEVMLRQARVNNPSADFRWADLVLPLSQWPLGEEEAFDRVICINGLNVIPYPKMVVWAAGQVLVPGGVFVEATIRAGADTREVWKRHLQMAAARGRPEAGEIAHFGPVLPKIAGFSELLSSMQDFPTEAEIRARYNADTGLTLVEPVVPTYADQALIAVGVKR